MKSGVVLYKNEQWSQLDKLPMKSEDVQVIYVFAERHLLEGKKISDFLSTQFTKAQIIYISTAGEINDRIVEEDAAVCVCMQFEKTPQQFAIENISQAANSFNLGVKVSKQLESKNLKYVLVISDGNLVNGDDLVKGIQTVLDPSVMVSGGVAGDGGRFEKTLVGLNDNINEGNVVLMGLYGEHIKVGTSFKGGWDVFGPERMITKSAGNVLFEIDNENALDLYKKYLGKYAEGLPSSALLFPLSIKSEDNDFFIVRTILSIDEKNKTMTFAGNLPEGSTVRFMKSNFDRLVQASSEAGLEATESLEKNLPVSLALIVSCVGRKLVLSDRIEEEVEAAIDNISAGATVAGFFSYGEIAPQKDKKMSHLHNQTITITTFAELP
jgi:hypothetical protein